MAISSSEMVKVQFYDSDVGYENLWATPITGDQYRLENVPFFIYGVSLNDIVQALPNPEGRLQFIKVVERSGSRTIRVRPDQFTIDQKNGNELVRRLEALGCRIEVKMPRLIAVDVPKEVQVENVTGFLASDGIPWEYANPTWEEIHEGTAII